jgi:hypothetical protein
MGVRLVAQGAQARGCRGDPFTKSCEQRSGLHLNIVHGESRNVNVVHKMEEDMFWTDRFQPNATWQVRMHLASRVPIGLEVYLGRSAETQFANQRDWMVFSSRGG